MVNKSRNRNIKVLVVEIAAMEKYDHQGGNSGAGYRLQRRMSVRERERVTIVVCVAVGICFPMSISNRQPFPEYSSRYYHNSVYSQF